MESRTLVLFDVDGTLVSGAETEHFEAMYRALAEVFALAPSRWPTVDWSGRTDIEIARVTLQRLGLRDDQIDAHLDELRLAWPEAYRALVPSSLADRVIPGAVDLLAWLAGDRGAALGLLTGNLESIARLKLSRAGLGRYFENAPGGFGSDAEDRGDLPDVARRRAGGDHEWPRERTIFVGDTPRDIRAARLGRIRCAAVATGHYPADQLGAADFVAEDAFGLEPILAGVLASDQRR